MGTSTRHPPTRSTAASSPTSDRIQALASWINEVSKKVNEVDPEHHPLGPSTIFKIPEHIRRLDERAYTPVVVPIGPFHHHPSQRESAMREHKWRCVRALLSRHNGKSKLLECLLTLKALDEDVRSCYSRKFSSNAQEMAEIMLLDGCFIIHLLLKHAQKEKKEQKKGGKVIVEVNEEVKEGCEVMVKEKRKGKQASGTGSGKRVRGELGCMIENMEELEDFLSKQEIVELENRKDHEKIKGPLEAGLFTVKVVLYDLLKLENQIPFFIIKTLFDLLIPEDDGINLPQRVLNLFCDIQPRQSKSFEIPSIDSIHHLLHLFHSSRIFRPQKQQQEKASGREWIPSATELRRAGVKFRKAAAETNFLDITFKNGRIEIPPLRVTDHTRSIFRNLIAFEQCYEDAMTYVTTYAVFMDCIIDEAKDAQLLHLKGILVNRLSTDKALAGLFNQLCNQIHYSPNNYLADMFVEVHNYYNSKFHKWRADFMRNYFSSPWTIISVIGAVFLLLMTIEQSVLACFSYLHPL